MLLYCFLPIYSSLFLVSLCTSAYRAPAPVALRRAAPRCECHLGRLGDKTKEGISDLRHQISCIRSPALGIGYWVPAGDHWVPVTSLPIPQHHPSSSRLQTRLQTHSSNPNPNWSPNPNPKADVPKAVRSYVPVESNSAQLNKFDAM